MNGQNEKPVYRYDAIIIPGGGLEPDTALPQPWVRARLDEALRRAHETAYFIVLSRGTVHKPPPMDAQRVPIDEAKASAKYLLDHGIEDPSRILMDCWSLDTIGNAYFARQLLCAPFSLRKLLVVTSQFHMPRTRAIFEWVFQLDPQVADLDYVVTENLGLDESQLTARCAKEQASLRVLQEDTIPRLKTVGQIARFIFQNHGAYHASASALLEPASQRIDRQSDALEDSDASDVRRTY